MTGQPEQGLGARPQQLGPVPGHSARHQLPHGPHDEQLRTPVLSDCQRRGIDQGRGGINYHMALMMGRLAPRPPRRAPGRSATTIAASWLKTAWARPPLASSHRPPPSTSPKHYLRSHTEGHKAEAQPRHPRVQEASRSGARGGNNQAPSFSSSRRRRSTPSSANFSSARMATDGHIEPSSTSSSCPSRRRTPP